jgi:hypothetical protein
MKGAKHDSKNMVTIVNKIITTKMTAISLSYLHQMRQINIIGAIV